MDIILKLDTILLEKESSAENETSANIWKRVIAARERQFTRYGEVISNTIVSNEKLLNCSSLTEEQEKMLSE